MPKQLTHLPKYWDPGRVKVVGTRENGPSFIVTASQAPHFQRIVMHEYDAANKIKKIHLLTLPIPYVYFRIRLFSYGTTLSAQVHNVGCANEEIDLKAVSLNVLPLPNTGSGLYTCSPQVNLSMGVQGINLVSEYKTPAITDEIAKATITHFWNGKFKYHEAIHPAHNGLYKWAGVKRSGKKINLVAYQKWSKLRLKDLPDQPWLKHPAGIQYSGSWI